MLRSKKDPMMVGTIGNLQPEKPEFKEYLTAITRTSSLGIRYGNLWGYNLVTQVENPTFIEGLKLCAGGSGDGHGQPAARPPGSAREGD